MMKTILATMVVLMSLYTTAAADAEDGKVTTTWAFRTHYSDGQDYTFTDPSQENYIAMPTNSVWKCKHDKLVETSGHVLIAGFSCVGPQGEFVQVPATCNKYQTDTGSATATVGDKNGWVLLQAICRTALNNKPLI